MLEDFRLKVFMAVSEERSFTGAARKLGVSQPAVSQNVSELEKELGTELFIRGRGSVSLTSAGKSFMEYAARILHWYSAAGDMFGQSGKLTGGRHVTIAADEVSASVILPGLMPRLTAALPGLSIKVIRFSGEEDCDISLRCRPHSRELSIDESAGYAGVLEAAAVTSYPAYASLDDLGRLPSKARFAIWSPYSDLLPADIRSLACVETYSPASVCGYVAGDPGTVGLLPKEAALGSGLSLMPVNLSSLLFDVMVLPSEESGHHSAFNCLRNLLSESYSSSL